ARALLGDVAGAGDTAAGRPLRQEHVRRTIVASAVAGLDRVTQAGRRPAHAVALGIGRAVIARAVARLGEVADAGGRPADRGALRVRRTGGRDARALLRGIADAGRGAAFRVRRHEAVRRALRTVAGAGLRDVAGPGDRPADDASAHE